VLLEQGVGGKVGSVSSCGENNSAHLGILYVSLLRDEPGQEAYVLALILVVYTNNLFTILDDLLYICLL
jgi:hypothetical protein